MHTEEWNDLRDENAVLEQIDGDGGEDVAHHFRDEARIAIGRLRARRRGVSRERWSACWECVAYLLQHDDVAADAFEGLRNIGRVDGRGVRMSGVPTAGTPGSVRERCRKRKTPVGREILL